VPLGSVQFVANGNGRQGGGAALGRLNPAANAQVQPRPATVIVVKADGSREERQVMIGVTSRVSAEVITGLSEGEQVIAGIVQATDSAGPRPQQNNGRGGFGGGGGIRIPR
jgi:macrolide-specific efflux system membrane fusion protein